ncbi:MAG TPA: 50S ribosomal protein L21 [Myxococcales bacterium LLY-WYZ-16_1]|jgi:large subunit ribosomal protein L21|nr:50S ribosomal protein L21 [Myxococcales bacterium LLY-WYZ-16_1]
MYAIVLAGGKQHRVQPGDLIKVEKVEGDVGQTVLLDQVLMVAGNGDPRVGQPRVEGAQVETEIVRQGRDRKILVFKKKRRKNYRRLYGHRQPFTHLRVKDIKVS